MTKQKVALGILVSLTFALSACSLSGVLPENLRENSQAPVSQEQGALEQDHQYASSYFAENTKVIEETRYYKIINVGFASYYYIYDENHNVVEAEGPLSIQPRISLIEGLVKVTQSAGPQLSTKHTYYYDVSKSVFSEVFYGVHDEHNGRVVYGTSKLIIRDIFDETRYYQELTVFTEPLSLVIDPIVEVRFVNGGVSIQVTYVTGTEKRKVTEVIEIAPPEVVDMPDQYWVIPKSYSLYESSSPQDFIAPEWFTDYASILDEYRRFADYSIEGGAAYVFANRVFDTPSFDLAYHWDCMIIEANIWSYRGFPKTREAYGYALKDLNGNGSPELILLLEDFTVLAVFSMTDGKPNILDAFWPRYSCAITDQGELITHGSSAAAYWADCIWQVSQDDGELILIEEHGLNGMDNWYKVVDGEKQSIKQSDFDEFCNMYPSPNVLNAPKITKDSGLEFIPLFSWLHKSNESTVLVMRSISTLEHVGVITGDTSA